MTFNGRPPCAFIGAVVAHTDGDLMNNYATNLSLRVCPDWLRHHTVVALMHPGHLSKRRTLFFLTAKRRTS